MDLIGRLRGALEPAVDLRVELSEPPVHRLRDAQQPPVDLGGALGELGAPVGAQVSQDARKPDERGRETGAQDQDQNDVCHRTDRR